MAHVVFYEKPGCINNTRQKRLLMDAGHTVEARDLRIQPWTAGTLRPFFTGKPVAEWFNKAAPAVKDGRIDPTTITAERALAAMIADPLLIRRPLMQVDEQRRCGFDVQEVEDWIGLAAPAAPADLESCPRPPENASRCA